MSRLAIYDINDYILNGTAIGSMLGYTTGSLRPIIPVQQQPEFNNENPSKPYLVYIHRMSPAMDMWWTSTDEITYMIWGKSLDEINTVSNEMINVFRRLDESASDLQDYLIGIGRQDFLFHYIRFVNTFSPEAADQEGGRWGKPLTIRVEYTGVNGIGVQ